MTSILVVDDDLQVRQLLHEVLVDEGFTVALAADGHQALALAREQRPSLILLDLTLPRLSGWELAAQLRLLNPNPIPIIVISGDGLAPTKARQLGAIAYLHKPFSIEQLLQAVARGLR